MSEPKHLTIARSYVGLREGPGATNNPRVVELYRLAGHPEVRHDSVAWCAAFIGAVLAKAGLKGTGTLWALDYAKWGQPLKAPMLGCIATKKRNGGGHVGFVVAANAKHIWLLGGNQKDAVSIARYERSVFNAFRWPTGVPVPTLALPTTLAGAKAAGSEA